MTVPLAVPHLGGNETRYVRECLESTFVSSVGPFVERFQREFAAFVGAPHAVACASGTAALHVALRLAALAGGADRRPALGRGGAIHQCGANRVRDLLRETYEEHVTFASTCRARGQL